MRSGLTFFVANSKGEVAVEYANIKTKTIFLHFIIPQMVGLVFNSVYFIVDGMFIGHLLGPSMLAAAGVAVPVVEGMIALSMLISVGTGVLVSAAAGKNNPGNARQIFNCSMVASLVFSVVVAVLGCVFTVPLARFLGASGAVLQPAVTYLRYFMVFSPFMLFSYALSTYARNDGKPSLAMWALIVGALLNIVLDWVFMAPLNMGIGGAALATGLGPVFSVALLLPHFLRRKDMLYFEKVKPALRTLGQIFVCGLPAFVTEFSIGFVTLLYNRAIVKQGLGENGLAAYVVLGYAGLIAITAFLGAAQGTQPVVSFLASAGQKAKVHRLFACTAAFLVLLAAGLYGLLFAGGQYFYALFMQGNANLVQFTLQSGRVYFLHLPLAAFGITYISFQQSAGFTGRAMVVSVARTTLPLMVALAVLPGLLPNGLWLAITAAEATALLLVLGLQLYKGGPKAEKTEKLFDKPAKIGYGGKA